MVQSDLYSIKTIILRLTLLFWIIFKLMSTNLWFSWGRKFPELPVFEFLSFIPSQLSDGLAIISILLMILAVIKPAKSLLIFLLIIELVLMSLDQMRWQPSLFQFIITVFIGVFNAKNFKSYFFFLISVTYVFSGIHKLNLGYTNFIWAKQFLVELLGISPEIAYRRTVKAIGLVLPVVEILAGLIIWTRYRKFGWVILILMHLLLILALGPLGLNTNSIVWPWNLLMIFIAILFIKNDDAIDFSFERFCNLKGGFLFILLVLLPLSSFFGKHSPYLSFNLYGGNLDYFLVHSTCLNKQNLTYKSLEFDNKTYISVFNWSMKELNVPMIPYLPVFEDFKFYYRKKCTGNSEFLIVTYPYKKEQVSIF